MTMCRDAYAFVRPEYSHEADFPQVRIDPVFPLNVIQ
jgi:hypothetical protein